MISMRVGAFTSLLLVCSCSAQQPITQQRPVLSSPIVATLPFTQYGQVKQSTSGLVIEYPCATTECTVDRFIEFSGAWPSGTYCIMYDSSAVAFYTVELKGGKKHGFERYYWTNGHLMRQLQYVDGVKTGIRFEYHPSGNLAQLMTFDPSGKLLSKCSFSDDQRSGIVYRIVDGVDVFEDWKFDGQTVVVTRSH